MSKSAEERTEEAQDYRRSLIGELLNGGFWLAVIGAVLGGIAFMISKIWPDSQFGTMIQGFVNNLMGNVSEEQALQASNEQAVEFARGALPDDLPIGDHTLGFLMNKDNGNREQTIAILTQNGFDFENPAISPDMINGLLTTLLQDDQYSDLRQGLLSKVIQDIDEIKAGQQPQNEGYLDSLRDTLNDLTGGYSEDALQRLGFSADEEFDRAQSAQLLTLLLKLDAPQGVSLASALLGGSQGRFLQTNNAAFAGLIQSLDDTQLQQVVNAALTIQAGVSAEGSEQGLFSDDMLTQLQALSELGVTSGQLKTFIAALDFSELGPQKVQAELARNWLLAASDVEGKSNLALIHNALQDTAIKEDVSKIFEQLLSPEGIQLVALNDITITQASANLVQQLNFDFKPFGEMVNDKIDNSTLAWIAGVEKIDLTSLPDLTEEISVSDEPEGDIDRRLNAMVQSKVRTAQPSPG